MLRIVLLAVILLLGVTRANAQISAENLPSLGNLGKLIGQADQAEVEQTIANQGGLISANIPAKDTARGRTATELANLLSEGDPARQKALEASFEQARVGYEKYLTDANFDKTDLGVALSANFIILWELASDTLLPPDSALKLGKYLVNIFGKASDAANAAEEDKSRLYDWLMTTPVVLAGLVDAYDEQGLDSEVATLRQKSADLFVELFAMPHSIFLLTEEGELEFDSEAIEDFQVEEGISDDW